MSLRNLSHRIISLAAILFLLAGCSTATPSPAPLSTSSPTTPPADENQIARLSDQEIATLNSLQQVDDYPLYTMRYYGAYQQAMAYTEVAAWSTEPSASPSLSPWACSLFAALGDPGQMLYGRNFDWRYSPAVLLFTDPPDAYASVSMVDITYFGFGLVRARRLTDLPLADRRELLSTPFLPFDGMNEHGLVVGMAAVPDGGMLPDPDKETIGSIMVIREMLDHARDVDEAAAIMQSYNIDMSGGPPIHYLIADASGRAVLVEFYQGEMRVLPNETPWHLATNFLRATAGESAAGRCPRYDTIHQRLTETAGQMTAHDATDLLATVSGSVTQWSVVYGISTGEVTVVMGREYEEVHSFHLSPHSQ